MCDLFGSSPSVDTSYQDQMLADAEEARRKEEERQARIQSGTEAINSQFGRFDDSFFGDFNDKYMGYYQPQLDDQFSDASDDLTFSLARAGTLNSSIAADARADLKTNYDTSRAGVLSEAASATDSLRSQVASEKSNLVSLLNATGNSEQAANEATARSQTLLKKQPTYNPLGDIFAGLTQGFGAAHYGRQQDELFDYYKNGARSPADSSRIVK